MSPALDHRNRRAFYLTGRRLGPGLDSIEDRNARPVLLARYRDLTTLRYDFPIVLVDDVDTAEPVNCLSGLLDRVLQPAERNGDAQKATRQVRGLEREIRTLVAEGHAGLFSTLWDRAAERLAARNGDDSTGPLASIRAALSVDGEVVDCDAALPTRLFTHLWKRTETRRARETARRANRLAGRLRNILRADFSRSEAGRRPESLRAAVGSLDRGGFDFEALSRVVSTSGPGSTLSVARRDRIRATLLALESHSGFAAEALVFTRAQAALAAHRERLPGLVAFAGALAVAELESAGEYREAIHDALFMAFGANPLSPDDVVLFPTILLIVDAAEVDSAEHEAIAAMLSAGLPVKCLVQTHDLLDESTLGEGHFGLGERNRHLLHTAIGQSDVYVLQAAGSQLYRQRAEIAAGLAATGAAYFSVFTGASPHVAELPAYLVAAMAVESRAFPSIVHDPTGGGPGASRVSLDANPQAERDWPVHHVIWEGPDHERISLDLPFTFVDFVATDRRHARHFAVCSPDRSDQALSVSDALDVRDDERTEVTPTVYLVDRQDVLRSVLVDEKLIREAWRCRDFWRGLQPHGRTARAAQAVEHAPAIEPTAVVPTGEALAAVAPLASTETVQAGDASAPARVSAAAESAGRASGDPYIETLRCTTCNECTRINPNLFAYNENRQAYVKNPDAGTYAQLVEAAESCQVSIIHPGQPRNPNEPGLPGLVERARAFL